MHQAPSDGRGEAHQDSSRPSVPKRARLNPPEASEYLLTVHGVRVARATLAKLRCVGGGPPFQRFGRSILYPRDELDAWALERLGAPMPNTSAQ
jgi:hypothetical protein